MRRYRPEQVVEKLCQAHVELGQGLTVPEVCRAIEVSQQTYYRWRQKYGGMSPELVKELKTLQKENQRLRKIVTPANTTFGPFWGVDCGGLGLKGLPFQWEGIILVSKEPGTVAGEVSVGECRLTFPRMYSMYSKGELCSIYCGSVG